MMRRTLLAALAVALCWGGIGGAGGAWARDRDVPREFQKIQPCPSTGRTRGACPGYQRDHIVPLCRGGADNVGNMQWLSVPAHKAKTRADVRGCRR